MREHQIGRAIRDAVNLGFAQIYTKPHTERAPMKGAANFAGGGSMVWDALRMRTKVVEHALRDKQDPVTYEMLTVSPERGSVTCGG